MKTRGKSVNYLDLGIDAYTSRGLGNLTAVIKSAVYMEFNNHGTQQRLRGKLSMFRAKAQQMFADCCSTEKKLRRRSKRECGSYMAKKPVLV